MLSACNFSNANSTSSTAPLAQDNPTPVITVITPSSARAGDATVTLTVNGNNFITESAVIWNGAPLTVQIVDSHTITAIVPGTSIATEGTASIAVSNPAPGGGASAAVTFKVVKSGVTSTAPPSTTKPNPTPVPAPPTPTPVPQPVSAPGVVSLSPNSMNAGGAAFTLSLSGKNFKTSTTVSWKGAALATRYVSETQLKALVPSGAIASAAIVMVAVSTPAPDGGSSNAVTFTVTSSNPVPTLASLSPGNINAGGPAFNLAINGSNFVSASTVKWNGNPLATSYISSTQLSATIPQTAIANAGTAGVSVSSPTPGGGSSGTLSFTIKQANPVPAIISLPTNSVKVGSGALTLTVNGNNFIASSIVYWNGMALSTHLVNANQLRASISAVLLATSGIVAISVANPTPGGGNSNTAAFTVAADQNPTGGSGPALVQYNIHQTYGSSASGGPLVWENDSVVQFKAGTQPGNTIWVVLTMSDYAGVHNEATITDTQGNAYTRLNQINDPLFMPALNNPSQNATGGAQTVEQFYATRIAGDSGAPDTITVHWNTEDYKGVLVTEIGGATGSPLVGFNGAFQDNLLAGTDNISSGPISINSGQTPALVMALSFNTLQNSAQPSAPKPGAGFTQITTLWDWAIGTGPSTTLEMKNVSSGGNMAGIFSAPGIDNYVTLAAVFH